jgi:hypothetical protein
MRTLALPALLLLTACATGMPDPPDGATDGGFVRLPDGGAPACRGNNDGVISRDELVFAPGIEVRYRINPEGTLANVNVRGTPRPDGTTAWDFSDPAGDLVTLSLGTASDQWYAPQFPGAQYAARLDPRMPLVGAYRAGDSSVDLLGVASEREADGTRLTYDTPVPLLRFPLMRGASWVAEANVVDGMVNRTPVASHDRYEITADAAGEVRLGVLTFRQAVRLRVELTQRFPVGPGVRRIQYVWLAECYGEVARVTSRDGEVDPDFTQATEFRRLGL